MDVNVMVVVRLGQDAIDISSAPLDEIGRCGASPWADDPVEVRPHRDPVVTVEHRELSLRGSTRWSLSSAADPGLERVQQQTRQDEVICPVTVSCEPLVGGVLIVNLRQDDESM